MSGDLNRERQKAIDGLEARAKAAYDKGNDQEAAEAYENAARLLERHAVAAPSRRIEQARKGKALRYREYANALRSGDIPKPEGGGGGELTQNRAGTGAARGRSKDEDEIHGAVTSLLHHSSFQAVASRANSTAACCSHRWLVCPIASSAAWCGAGARMPCCSPRW